MTKALFKDFDPISGKAWKQKIQVDLKGTDYNDTLIWKTAEGIDVKPFYHSDDFTDTPTVSNTATTAWKIAQFITVTNVTDANKWAVDALQRGAESIVFHIISKDISVKELLKDIDLNTKTVNLKLSICASEIIEELKSHFTNEISSGQLNIHSDIIGNLGKSGNWFSDLKTDHSNFERLIGFTNTLYVDLSTYQNAGATATQQLAYALAHTSEYLNHLDAILSNETKQSIKVVFNVAVGSNYFFEISKLKALRQLWETLATEFGYNTNCQIITSPSKRNKTIYDYNVNLLRTTTECMSAVLGGADTVYNLPYNSLFQKPTEFGERIARNQLLILKSESYFNAVDNPTDGAYYVESLANQLAENALDIFKTIEANGGFLSQLKDGTIQRKIKESAQKEQDAFDAEQIVLLGTNKHPNAKDQMKNSLEVNPFLEVEKRKTLLEPIIERRLSEVLEQKRLKEE